MEGLLLTITQLNNEINEYKAERNAAILGCDIEEKKRLEGIIAIKEQRLTGLEADARGKNKITLPSLHILEQHVVNF